MSLDHNTRILIVGLGLMGGSYARALTDAGYAVSALDTNEKSISFALREGIIQNGGTAPTKDFVGNADLVIFALYPHIFIEWLRQYQHLLRPGAILTDVTGVKALPLREIGKFLRPDVEFIAAHPMAGREVYGVENSTAAIFQGANFIVVPTKENTPAAVSLCRELGKTLGFARVSELSPEEHDEMIGFVSQLTHCIAVALMTCKDNQHLVDYTGDSFRDLTRIARINDAMWSELFLDNKEALLREMDLFIGEMQTLREALNADDRETLREKMRLSTARRALFDKK